MKSLILIIFFSFCFEFVHAQNLVTNGHFESYKTCEIRWSNLQSAVNYWQSAANDGTVDYFHPCATDKLMRSPYNRCGFQHPRSGKGYMGFFAVTNAEPNYREYLMTKLAEPMKKGTEYRLNFYLSLAEISNSAVHSIGALFTDKWQRTNRYEILKHKPQLVNTVGNYLIDSTEWMALNFNYTAKGGEEFLIIGNFNSITETDYKKFKDNPGLFCYYYIEDVSVVAVSEDVVQPKNITTFVPKPIYFNFDKAELQSISYTELNKLANYLSADSTLQVLISGHTDSVGNENYNNQLSEKRAKAAADFLISKGINSNRISVKAEGETKPAKINNSTAGRKLNRRVMFEIK